MCERLMTLGLPERGVAVPGELLDMAANLTRCDG
jgi:hypothetical protein